MTRKYQRISDEQEEHLAPDAPLWMRNEHQENCCCGLCEDADAYYTLGSDHLQRSLSIEEAQDLLSLIEQAGDTRITATIVYSTQQARGPRYHLLLQLRSRTTRRLPCRSLAEWRSIQRLWEGL